VKKLILTTIGALSTSLLLVGCTSQNSVISDISETSIAVPVVHSTEIPSFKRVVALANGSAEIVTALGYKSILVGRDVASTIPELSKVPIDNPGHTVSIEKVLSQKPDLILIDSNTSPATALDTLRKSGIPMAKISDPFNLKGVLLKEKEVAAAIGVPGAGAVLSRQVANVSFPKSPIKVAFLYVRGTSAIYLIGGKGSGADSLLAAIGMRDVGAEKLPHPFNAMTAEELIAMQPDVLLLMTKGLQSVNGIEGLVALPGIAQTPAGKNRAVVTVDDSLLLSFGPRSVALLPKLRMAIEGAVK
jgi:iron complex transport system substrate-binding protein